MKDLIYLILFIFFSILSVYNTEKPLFIPMIMAFFCFFIIFI